MEVTSRNTTPPFRCLIVLKKNESELLFIKKPLLSWLFVQKKNEEETKLQNVAALEKDIEKKEKVKAMLKLKA